MKLDERTLRLISVGASIGANCRACLETSIVLALENGATEPEIEQAIAAGRKIRQCATQMDRLAGQPNRTASTTGSAPSPCGTPSEAIS